MLLLNHIPVLCLLLSSAIAAAQVDESSTTADEAASTDQADAQNDVLPRPGIEANQDGYPYNVSTIQLAWKYPHQDLPKLSTLLATPLVLTHTTEGWIGARPGHEVITSLAAINEAGGIIWSSALSDVVRVLTAVLIQDGLLGVVVRVDPEQISDDQANLFQDIRPEGDTDLKLILTVGRIKEVRTVASGDRVTEEDRVNSPLHVAIRNKSPLQGDREVTANRSKVICCVERRWRTTSSISAGTPAVMSRPPSPHQLNPVASHWTFWCWKTNLFPSTPNFQTRVRSRKATSASAMECSIHS